MYALICKVLMCILCVNNELLKYVQLIIHSVIHDLLQTKADEVDVQLKKERLEYNVLQQRNAELKVCASLSCKIIM